MWDIFKANIYCYLCNPMCLVASSSTRVALSHMETSYRHRLLLILLGVVCTSLTLANTPIKEPNWSMKTKIAPAYFGPNAFQVPEMLDGRTSQELRISLSADHYAGMLTTFGGDVTSSFSAKVVIPLFSSRVNIAFWMPVVEYYRTNAEVNEIRRLPYTYDLEGWDSGDLYVSTDIQLFTQQLHGADIAIRAAIKTASGNTYALARYYDAPGYFFDAAIGRDLVSSDRTVLRLAASSGFLCWQTDVGRQNDAVMYGAQASLKQGALTLKAEFGGYVGWERDGDCPMVISTMLSYAFNHLFLRAQYKEGLADWPFRQFSLGVTYCY